MRLRTLAFAGILAASLGLAACGSDNASDAADTPTTAAASSPAADMTDMADTPAMTDMTGMFAGANGKNVAGTASISGDTLTLSGFSTDPGPDLHVYLTNGTDEAAVSAGMELGKVSTGASQTFMLSGDASGYTDVVIHCDKAKAVFGAAMLS